MHRFLAFALLFILSVQPVVAYGVNSSPDLKSSVEAYLNNAEAFGFSGSVLLMVDGKMIVHKGYGLADRNRGVPVKADDVFDIGSVTKQFTAAAIMKLEMQGKLKTEDLISKYLDGVPADKAGITLHQTLTHTAGFSQYSGGDYEISERDETIARILKTPRTHTPGVQMRYSNSGYSILAAIIEKVSGQGYETFLAEQLFKPAGMTSTGYVLPKFDKAKLPRAYEAGKDLGTALDHKWSPTGPYWNLFGNGGIFSTTGDLYKWYLALQGEKVLSAAAKKKLFTPNLNDYAYGWDVSKTPMGLLITHNGASDNGFNADFAFYPEKNTVGIVLSNAGTFMDSRIQSGIVLRSLSHMIAGEEVKMPAKAKFAKLDAAARTKLTGKYRMARGDEFHISVYDGAVAIEPFGQSAVAALGQFPADDLALAKLNEKAKPIAAALMKKDFAMFKDSVGDAAVFDRLKGVLEQRIAEWEKSDGAYQSFSIGGTGMSWWAGQLQPSTFVRLQFEKQSRLFRFIWNDGKIVNIGGSAIPAPITIPLQPTSATDFAGWHLITTRPIGVRFSDKGSRITVIANGITSTAVRVE